MSGWGESAPENFRIFDNDYFETMKKLPGVWGAVPPELFVMCGAKILLTSKKSANQQGGSKRVKIT